MDAIFRRSPDNGVERDFCARGRDGAAAHVTSLRTALAADRAS